MEWKFTEVNAKSQRRGGAKKREFPRPSRKVVTVTIFDKKMVTVTTGWGTRIREQSEALLVSKRDQRIDTGRPPSRDEASRKGNHQEE